MTSIIKSWDGKFVMHKYFIKKKVHANILNGFKYKTLIQDCGDYLQIQQLMLHYKNNPANLTRNQHDVAIFYD
jgi:hypothetical protein